MNNIKLAQKFLSDLTAKDSEPTFESLSILVEKLESKADPHPVEVQLVTLIYEYVEKLRILELSLKEFVKDSNKDALGHKLDSLYDRYSRSIFE